MKLMRCAGAYIVEEAGLYRVRLHPDRRRKAVMSLTPAQFTKAFEGQTLLRLSDHSLVLAQTIQAPAKANPLPRAKPRFESPFAYLFQNKTAEGLPFLSRLHYLALEQLRDDIGFGYCQNGLTMNWQAFGSGGGGTRASYADLPLNRLKARDRAQAALTALGSQRSVFERICLEGTAIGVVERGLGLGKRNGKKHLKLALDRLVEFYRLG